MMWDQYIRILAILGMITVICSTAGAASAAVQTVAVTYPKLVTITTAVPVCTDPCECMAEGSAAAKWGPNGYTQCSKTPCGRAATATAVIPYYCFRPLETTTLSPAPCQAPCQCMERTAAAEKWGTNAFTMCSKVPCKYAKDVTGVPVTMYCFSPLATTTTTGAPLCAAPCQCMPAERAAEKYGTDGYTQCSETPCGQAATATGVIPSYCYKPLATPATTAVPACTAPCQCMPAERAAEKYGANGFSQCSQVPCDQVTTATGVIPSYCYKPLETTTPPPVLCKAPCQCMEWAAATEKWGANGFSRCSQSACEYTTDVTGALVTKYCVQQVSGVSNENLVPVSGPTLVAMTAAPVVCPNSDWACLTPAEAAQQFGYPNAQYGDEPCGYTLIDNQTVAKYCTIDVPSSGILAPEILAARGIRDGVDIYIKNETGIQHGVVKKLPSPDGGILQSILNFIQNILGGSSKPESRLEIVGFNPQPEPPGAPQIAGERRF